MSSSLVTLSGTGRYLRAHLVVFHAPAAESLLQRSLVTFWVEDVFRNQKLGTRYANWVLGCHCYEALSVDIPPNTHTHISIFISTSPFTSVWNLSFILMIQNSIQMASMSQAAAVWLSSFLPKAWAALRGWISCHAFGWFVGDRAKVEKNNSHLPPQWSFQEFQDSFSYPRESSCSLYFQCMHNICCLQR